MISARELSTHYSPLRRSTRTGRKQETMPGIGKTHNEYAACIVEYDRIPKAVLAAIAYSFASRSISDPDSPTMIDAAIMDEWEALHANGIVPQKPPKS